MTIYRARTVSSIQATRGTSMVKHPWDPYVVKHLAPALAELMEDYATTYISGYGFACSELLRHHREHFQSLSS